MELLKVEDGWSCHECRAQGVPVVELGEDPWYESSTARICLDCLKKAIAMIETQEGEPS